MVDAEECVNYITKENPRKYDPTSRNNQQFRKDIFSKAYEKVFGEKETFGNENSQSIYDLIYDKKSSYGLSSFWDRSIHLVTTNKSYPTQTGNLNFIFNDDDSWYEHWEFFYRTISWIYLFSSEVIIKVFENIIDAGKMTVTFNACIRSLKNNLATNTDFDEEVLGIVTEFLDSMTVTCEYCGNKYKIEEKIRKEFIQEYLYTCPV